MFGHRRHHGNHQHRIVHRKLYGVYDLSAGTILIDVIDPNDVGQENAIKQPPLGCTGQVLPNSSVL
jgi:hypothetical protein